MVGALSCETGFAGSMLNKVIFHDARASLIQNLSCYYVAKKKFQFVYALLLYARFLIYPCKYSKSRPNMTQCFCLLNSVKRSECIHS